MIDQNKVLEMVKAEKRKKQKGASMIEYALVVAAIVGVGGVLFNGTDGTLDTAMKDKMSQVASDVKGDTGTGG